MGELKYFWDSKHVDISATVHIYLTIPVYILRWGYHISFDKNTINEIKKFYMKSLRRILNIKWDNFWEQRITNGQVRNIFIKYWYNRQD